jgi:hypothetical protein
VANAQCSPVLLVLCCDCRLPVLLLSTGVCRRFESLLMILRLARFLSCSISQVTRKILLTAGHTTQSNAAATSSDDDFFLDFDLAVLGERVRACLLFPCALPVTARQLAS